MNKLVLRLLMTLVLCTGRPAIGLEKSAAEKIMEAAPTEFAHVLPQLKANAKAETPDLVLELERVLPADSSEPERERLAQRQANAAAALLAINAHGKVWPLFGCSEDPRARSYLIHRLEPMGVDPLLVINRLYDESDVSIRRALLLCLGEFDVQALPQDVRKRLLPNLREIYSLEADAGLHSASEWLLRKWQQNAWVKQSNEKWASDLDLRETQFDRMAKQSLTNAPIASWYVNGQGQTIAVIRGPVEFLMGEAVIDAGKVNRKRQHHRRISRSFGLSSKLVTLGEYRQFHPTYAPNDETHGRTLDLPVVEIGWSLTAAYCNWLSKSEGIPEAQWCFENQGEEIRAKKDYLTLTGYRLPTQAEMEYTMRAGAITSRFYGEAEELLGKYAWHQENSRGQTQPVGRLKPNDLGLFDALGNAFASCLGKVLDQKPAAGDDIVEDQGDEPFVDPLHDRIASRGSSYNLEAARTHCAVILCSSPPNRCDYVGFRVARTMPLKQSNQ